MNDNVNRDSRISEYMPRYFAPTDSVKSFYHYTTMKALLDGIIVQNPTPNKEICMHATYYAYMNDFMEIQTGINALIDFYYKQQKDIYPSISKKKYRDRINSEISDQWKHIYIISFSQEADSLPMWNMYSDNGRGISIEFNREGLPINNKDLLLQCHYSKNKLIESLNVSGIEHTLAYAYTPFILKNKSYSFEKEIRMIGVFEKAEEKFKERKGIAVPYKELFLTKSQIKSIMIGPAADKDLTEKSLRRFLDKCGFGHVKIRQSTIPFRS